MRKLLLGVGLVSLDACWLGGWLAWLNAGLARFSAPELPVLAAVGVAGATVAHVLALTRRPGRQLEAVAVLSGLGVAVVLGGSGLRAGASVLDPSWLAVLASQMAMPATALPILLNVGAVLKVWRNGSQYVSRRQSGDAVWRAVNRTVAALAILAIAARMTPAVDLAWPVLGAVGASLGVLAVAQLEDAASGYAGTRADLGRSWLAVLLCSSAVILLVAFVMLWALATGVPAMFAPLATVFARATDAVVTVAGQVLIVVLDYLFRALMVVLNAIAPRLSGESLRRLPSEPLLPEAGDLEGPALPAPLAAGLWLAVLGVALWLVVRWLRRGLEHGGHEDSPTADREWNPSLGRTAGDLAAAWRAALGAGQQVMARLGPGPGGVRAIYRRYLRLMAQRGLARRPDQTPDEYLPTGQAALPGAASDVQALTRAYVRVRYGERQQGVAEFNEVRARWRSIRRASG